MALWGSKDQANNSPLYTPAQFNKKANTANRNALFGNTTANAFVNNAIVGVFGVDNTEMAAEGAVVSITLVEAGSGYTANAVVTIDGSATAVTEAGADGHISSITITSGGSNYTSAPAVVIDPPTAISFNSNSAVDATKDFIGIASNVLQNGDKVTYKVAAGNTALTNLVDGGQYYITEANSTGVKLSVTVGGTAVDLTKGVTESGHSLTGETATAVALISGPNGVAHAGWNLRRVGTGGRAGRVTYETLVAMGSMSGDTEDTIFPDS